MESFLKRNFEIPAKNPSEEAQRRRWRKYVERSAAEALQLSIMSEGSRKIDNVTYWKRLTRLWTCICFVIMSPKMKLLLPFGPLSILLYHLTRNNVLVFFFSSLGIVPLSECLNYASEWLAFYIDPIAGELLNTTFGNATKVVFAILQLKSGMIRAVQLSLLGSILSNMLLGLGCSFFIGAIKHYNNDQVFNLETAVVSSELLLMGVIGILFPAVLHFTQSEVNHGKSEVVLSRFSSCIMLVAYGSYLVFRLKSHYNHFKSTYDIEAQNEDDNSDEKDAPEIVKWEAIACLAVLTIWLSIISDYLVNSTEGISKSWNLPLDFISVILLPIIGDATTNASAIMSAMNNKKLDLTLEVLIGSSTQTIMFVIPFCVVVAWIMGKPMDLNFQIFETATLFITSLLVVLMLQRGKATYLKGIMLILFYLIVAASFFVHVDPTTTS